MVKIFDINDFDERKQFEIKLQIALLNNTLKIRENSKNPEKYDEYIGERKDKIRGLLNTTAKFAIKSDVNIAPSLEASIMPPCSSIRKEYLILCSGIPVCCDILIIPRGCSINSVLIIIRCLSRVSMFSLTSLKIDISFMVINDKPLFIILEHFTIELIMNTGFRCQAI